MKRLADELESKKIDNLYRKRVVREGQQDPIVFIDGKKAISFCGNNYLGLASHPAVIQAFIDGANKYGVGSGSSNLISGYTDAQKILEEELANKLNSERVLVFNSGYFANIGTILSLTKKNSLVLADKLNHASLVDACKYSEAKFIRYRHGDLEHLSHYLRSNQSLEKLIVSDTVFSMDGDIVDIESLTNLSKKFSTPLMLDDAHGFGIFGPNGLGIADKYKAEVRMATFGKALGTFGAFIAGSETLIEHLIQTARTYIYTTAMPPAIAEATRTSLKLLDSESWRREKLMELVAYFKKGADELDLPIINSITPIQPLVVGSADKVVQLSSMLLDNGIHIAAIRPPSVPAGTSRLRITITATHEIEHIDYLFDVFSTLRKAKIFKKILYK